MFVISLHQPNQASSRIHRAVAPSAAASRQRRGWRLWARDLLLLGSLLLWAGCTPKVRPPTEAWASEPLADWIQAEKRVVPAARPAGYADYSEQLRASVQAHAPAMQRCYRQTLQHDRALYGEVVMRLVLQADGTVQSAEVDFGTLQGPELEVCLLKVFRTLKVARPPREGYVVRYPLVFTSARTPPEVVDALRRRYQLAAPVEDGEEKRSKPPADPIPW